MTILLMTYFIDGFQPEGPLNVVNNLQLLSRNFDLIQLIVNKEYVPYKSAWIDLMTDK